MAPSPPALWETCSTKRRPIDWLDLKQERDSPFRSQTNPSVRKCQGRHPRSASVELTRSSSMPAELRQEQHTLLGTMSQVLMDLLYSLTNCMFCFPGSPQLKINNRSFKMQHLLGEVSASVRVSLYPFATHVIDSAPSRVVSLMYT